MEEAPELGDRGLSIASELGTDTLLFIDQDSASRGRRCGNGDTYAQILGRLPRN